MKKQEAELIAIDESRVMIEYLEQILSDDNISGNMTFRTSKVEGEDEKMCTVDIILSNGKEKHLNLGIPSIHSDIFTRQFTSDLVERFAKDDIMGVSPYFEIKSMPPISRSGMDAMSINEETGKINNHIKIDFYYKGQDFDSIMEEYNKKLKEAQKEIEEEAKVRK